jgi:hypothetical protein
LCQLAVPGIFYQLHRPLNFIGNHCVAKARLPPGIFFVFGKILIWINRCFNLLREKRDRGQDQSKWNEQPYIARSQLYVHFVSPGHGTGRASHGSRDHQIQSHVSAWIAFSSLSFLTVSWISRMWQSQQDLPTDRICRLTGFAD